MGQNTEQKTTYSLEMAGRDDLRPPETDSYSIRNPAR